MRKNFAEDDRLDPVCQAVKEAGIREAQGPVVAYRERDVEECAFACER